MLRGEAADAEARGISWREFAAELLERDQMEMPELLPSDGKDAVVLMTCQKAKGQEWPVVILPGLSRPMRPAATYMKSIEVLMDASNLACRTRGVQTSNWKDLSALRAEQSGHEMRRVYYVACTRAKNHLIFVDTRHFWVGDSKLMRPIEALSAPMENDEWFSSVEPWVAPVTRAIDHVSAEMMEEESLPADLRFIDRIVAPAVRHPSQVDAGQIPVGIEEDHEKDPFERRVEPLHGALIYGDWWHETMRDSDWSQKEPSAAWRSAMADLPEGPLRDRAAKELKVLASSELLRELRVAREFHREMPYARRLAPRGIEDGKIDLLYRMADGKWKLIDWKTDAVDDEAEAAKRARHVYSAQMAAYQDALRCFGVEVAEASLYFTAIGKVVRIG
jgi:ATP-dependent exoDNAse (exonuclease V) beta subunit